MIAGPVSVTLVSVDMWGTYGDHGLEGLENRLVRGVNDPDLVRLVERYGKHVALQLRTRLEKYRVLVILLFGQVGSDQYMPSDSREGVEDMDDQASGPDRLGPLSVPYRQISRY